MNWLDCTWTELDALDRSTAIPILPIGAIEAHGPHLPLGTDGIISLAMARAAVSQLEAHGLQGLILPCLDFTPAGFANAFAGTISFRPETTRAILQDLCAGLAGFPVLAVANSHLDPGHLASLALAFQDCPLPVAFPDLTRRRWASQMTEEFQSGACHAGQYEGSVVAAVHPELVRWDVAAALPDNPSSLVTAMRAGATSFAEAGGPRAYFGSPRSITAEEGRQTIERMGRMLVESVLSTLKC